MKKGFVLLIILILSLFGIVCSYGNLEKIGPNRTGFGKSFFQDSFFQDPFLESQFESFNNFEKHIQNKFDSLFSGFNRNLNDFDGQSSFYSQSVILKSNKLVLEIFTNKNFLENLETKFKTFCEKNNISLNIEKKSDFVKFVFRSSNIREFYNKILQIVSDSRSNGESLKENKNGDTPSAGRGIEI